MFSLTLAAGPLRALHAQLRSSGADADAFFESRGIAPSVLDDRDGRVPVHRLVGIWEAAAQVARDPHFGLHASARLESHELGLVGDLCTTSTTLGAALDALTRYLRLVTETLALRVERRDSSARLVAAFRMPPFAQGRHVVEFTVGAVFQFLRPHAMPRELCFRHREPEAAEHARFFAAPVRFEQDSDALELDAALLDRPIASADSERARRLEALASRVLVETARSGTVADQVARVQMGELRRGREPRIEDVAKELAVSVRSLQRALVGEGASFTDQLDALRKGLALHHVAEAQLPLSAVAWSLGFTETAAFHRAFKRWTGTTPAVWRSENGGSPARRQTGTP